MMTRMVRSMMCMNPMTVWNMASCRRETATWGQDSGCKTGKPGRSILETAGSDPSFTTLQKAVEVSGLTEFLQGAGPFTLFAPADSAFAALPAGALDELLRPENRARLVSTLKNHVAPGRILSSEIARLESVRTYAGLDLRVRTQGGVVLLDNTLVVKPDIQCSNGVIHVINGVLPPA